MGFPFSEVAMLAGWWGWQGGTETRVATLKQLTVQGMGASGFCLDEQDNFKLLFQFVFKLTTNTINHKLICPPVNYPAFYTGCPFHQGGKLSSVHFVLKSNLE